MSLRSLARRVLHRVPAGAPIDRTVVGAFERDDGSALELWRGYRDVAKPGWRSAWPPVRELRKAGSRVALPPAAAALVAELETSSTLPAPLEQFVAALSDVASARPDVVHARGGTFEVVPTNGEIEQIVESYRLSAAAIVEQLARVGARVEGERVLEVGAASGYLTLVLASLGADAVGIDATSVGWERLEHAAVRAALLDDDDTHRFVAADGAALPYPDASFDAIVSISVVEHLVDLPAVLAETARVLRPGGIAYHGVHPWYCATGGHALCSVDAPWGHVRLTEDEFVRYARELRPYEADEAIAAYRTDFQQPRRTFAGLHAAVVEAGFEIVRWDEARRDPPHVAILEGALLEDCRARAPEATTDDLLRGALTIVLRRA